MEDAAARRRAAVRFVEWAESGGERTDATAQTAITVFHALLRREGIDPGAEDNITAKTKGRLLDRAATQVGLFLVGLGAALAIPDMCSAMEATDGLAKSDAIYADAAARQRALTGSASARSARTRRR